MSKMVEQNVQAQQDKQAEQERRFDAQERVVENLIKSNREQMTKIVESRNQML